MEKTLPASATRLAPVVKWAVCVEPPETFSKPKVIDEGSTLS